MEQQYCLHSHISPEILCQTTLSWDSGVINLLKHSLAFFRSDALPHLASPNNMRTNKILLTKSSMLNESGAVTSSFGWTRHSVTLKTSRSAWAGGPSLSCFFPQCQKAVTLTDFLPDDLIPQCDMIVKSSRNRFRSRGALLGVTGLLLLPANGEN